MQEILGQLFAHIAGVWRHRWMGLVVAWLIAVLGWAVVAQMPKQYLATARVHVDSNSILRPLLRGVAIQPNIDQRVELMSRTLISRPNLEKLMRMTDLDLQVKSEQDKERILGELKSAISLVGSRRNSSLYSVSFYHADRDMAKKVVQSLITVFIESTMGGEHSDAAGAQNFLDQQIADYEQRLVEAESRLANFKQKNAGLLPGKTGGYYQRLNLAQGQLSEAQLSLREAQNRRDELKRQLSGEQPVFLSSGSATAPQSSLDGRINLLKSKLDSLLTRYTEKHPEVVQINSLIASLEKERDEELKKAIAGESTDLSGLSTSPVYQQMRTMLAETEAGVAELNVRVSEYQRRVKELEDLVDSVPVIEAELTQLNRDYEVVAQQHTELLQRREAARISEDAEQQANDLVFKVIDPPFVPLKPNKPNKLILNAGVLLLALAAGVGAALLTSLLRPVITGHSDLRAVTGLPVLGSVMFIPTSAQKRAITVKNIQFAALMVMMVVVFAVVNVSQLWLFA